jgi:hypothetical protein
MVEWSIMKIREENGTCGFGIQVLILFLGNYMFRNFSWRIKADETFKKTTIRKVQLHSLLMFNRGYHFLEPSKRLYWVF